MTPTNKMVIIASGWHDDQNAFGGGGFLLAVDAGALLAQCCFHVAIVGRGGV